MDKKPVDEKENKEVAEKGGEVNTGGSLDIAILEKLKESNVKYVDLLIGKINRQGLALKDDGTVDGLEEQIEGLKKCYPDLFAISEEKPVEKEEKPEKSEGSGEGQYSKSDLEKMSPEEINANWDKVKKAMK